MLSLAWAAVTVLEQRIISAAEPYLGARASTVLSTVSLHFMKRPLAELDPEQVVSLAYWVRIVIGTSDIEMAGRVADLERSIRAVIHPTGCSVVNREGVGP